MWILGLISLTLLILLMLSHEKSMRSKKHRLGKQHLLSYIVLLPVDTARGLYENAELVIWRD